MRLLRLFPAGLVGLALSASDWYLFTSFRSNGEKGVFLALSPDGRAWTPLNNNQPWRAEWWLCFDHYVKPAHYGAVRTRDWKKFEDMSGQVAFPAGHRHGTVVRTSAKTPRGSVLSHGHESETLRKRSP